MTKEIGVGKETLSYCSKCKLTLSHIIAAMKDLDTIAKVFCKTCKATHAYKDPNKASKKKVVSHRRKTEMRSNSKDWEEAMKQASSDFQTYSPKAKFVKGDLIEHPKFGQGIIEKLLDKNKIEVLFKNNRKVLIHNI